MKLGHGSRFAASLSSQALLLGKGEAEMGDDERPRTAGSGGIDDESPSKKMGGGFFGTGGKTDSDAPNSKKKKKKAPTYVVEGDPFQPGGNYIPPPYDAKQSEANMKLSIQSLEKVVGKQVDPMEGLRVWLALGCRGLGVHGEEGLGTVVAVFPEKGQLRVKWDESEAEHEYSCGMYKVYHLSVFEYTKRKDWMMGRHKANWAKKNKGPPPRIEKNKELEVMMGYRMDDQLKHRVSYVRSKCAIM